MEKIGHAISEKMFKDNKILYLYIAQGQGQKTLGDKIFDCNLKGLLL